MQPPIGAFSGLGSSQRVHVPNRSWCEMNMACLNVERDNACMCHRLIFRVPQICALELCLVRLEKSHPLGSNVGEGDLDL
jgi:hypothetical protein